MLDPALGFPNSADKIAWIAAHLTLAASLPTAKSTSDGYPVISAAAAYRLMRSMGGKQRYPVTTWLSVDKVRLGQAAFDTDRGPVKLPRVEVRARRRQTPRGGRPGCCRPRDLHAARSS